MPPTHPRRLVLGSTSVYRKSLLERLGLPFETASPHVDEAPHPSETPRDTAARLAMAKALAVARRHPDAIVIGSDQVADWQGQPLGKPGQHDRAVEQLKRLSGHRVIFHCAVAVACTETGHRASDMATVEVQFRELADDEIEHYLRTEQPYDCAGSAKSEGLGITLLEHSVSDDPTALIGLPLIRTARLLRAAGLDLPRLAKRATPQA